MLFTTLISPSELASHIDDPTWAIVDCRFKLDDVAWGEQAYTAAHIPGAVYAHLDHDLSRAKTGTNGRHPLPEPDAFARTLGRFGISRGVQVVAYDQDNSMFASRLWWMLRWLGHDAAAVLDGGFARWVAGDRPVRSGVETRAPRTFAGAPREDMAVDADAVHGFLGDRTWRLVDARAPERYRGDVEQLDKVAGHIPGAANHFYQTNVDATGLFRSPDELRTMWDESLGGAAADRVVCYCGSGVTACHNILALEHAGIKGVKLYPGSWSEWCSDPKRPIEKSTVDS
jgi:thiosulfate/3-mercaptopyruvate sulfurtransferase